MLSPKDFEDYDTLVDVEVSPDPGMVLCVRFADTEADRLSDIAAARDMSIPQLAHDLILEALEAVLARPSTR